MKGACPRSPPSPGTDFDDGTDSGGHGIFGFTDLKPGPIPALPNFLDVKRETEALGHARKDGEAVDHPEPAVHLSARP